MDSNSDSDFYGTKTVSMLLIPKLTSIGNDQEVQNLRDRAQDFNSTKWWTRHGLNGGTQSHATTTSIMKKDDRLSSPIHKIKLEETEAEAKPLNTFSPSCTESSSNNKAAGADAEEDSPEDGNSRSDSDSNNPYAGVPFAWQYNETLSSFLARLPPSTTPQTKETPWIYVCNPCWKHSDTTTVTIKHEERPFSSSPPAKPPLGCENEGPLPHTALEGGGLRHFIHGGKQRLGILAQFAEDLRTEKRMTTARKEKELVDERKLCAEDILTLAHFSHVRVGKVSASISNFRPLLQASSCQPFTTTGCIGLVFAMIKLRLPESVTLGHNLIRITNDDAVDALHPAK